VLHFTNQEMFWDCRSDWLCECGHTNGRKIKTPLQNFHDLEKSLSAARDTEDLGECGLTDQVLQRWADIMSQFSRTRLTYDSDMLPAISGIAQRFHNTTLGRYLAGMWEANLAHQLMWNIFPSKDPLSFGRLTAQYTAPTFSPLSRVGGTVSFGNRWKDDQSVKVVEAKTVPLGPNPTGPVISGYVILCGPVLAIRTGSTRPSDFNDEFETTCYSPSEEPLRLLWMPDADELLKFVEPGVQLYILRFAFYFSLILRQDETDTDVFYRIGSTFRTHVFRAEMEKAVSRTMTIK
jgi:hypothetical protein